jgi:PAS domain S-box-containing protein
MTDSLPVMLLRIDVKGVIEYMNYVMPQYKMEDVIGSEVFQYVSPEYIQLYKDKISFVVKTGESTHFGLEVIHNNGAVAWFDLHMSPVIDGDKIESIVVVTLDVTEKKIAQEKLENALNEKEILLKEVHHRAKNNLQILSSILNLQKDKTSDHNVLGVLDECKNSIHSLALAHECLYKSNDFTRVDFSDYLERFCAHFNMTVNKMSKVELKLNLTKTFVSMDKAITSGLIISEILINAFKHAFLGREKGLVTIELKNRGNQITLNVCDDGVGFPEDVKLETSESLGLELIRVLVDQLDGEILMSSNQPNGTCFKIDFKKE